MAKDELTTVTVQGWAAELDVVGQKRAGRFARAEPRQ